MHSPHGEHPLLLELLVAAVVLGMALVVSTCVGWRTTEGGRWMKYKITMPSDNRDDIHRQHMHTVSAVTSAYPQEESSGLSIDEIGFDEIANEIVQR
jgi:hypothetical protein